MSLSEAEQIAQLRQQLHWAELKIQVLEERLRLQLIAKYGPASEKLNDAQLELLEQEPGVSHTEVQAESERAAEPVTAGPRERRPHPGRQELPAHLPRREKILVCLPEQCTCQACGRETTVIGYEHSEQLDVEPARYFVLVTKREKRACRTCPQQGVTAAALPPRVLDKGLVSDRVVIDTIVAKYSDHLPLYRQSAILARDAGVAISRATLDSWVVRVGELLLPIASAIRQELLHSCYLQADETPVAVQMPDKRGKHQQAYLWQYGTPGGSVVFDFQLGRGRAGPQRFLRGYEGLLQSDGYAAYEQVGGPKMVHACCWAHARRKYLEALKLHPEDRVAARLVAQIDELFAIDAEARSAGLDHAARQAVRLARAQPLLEALQPQIEAAHAQALPASALGKATRYTLALWPKLTRFLQYPELELSNNLAENSMRPIALGRKTGSTSAVPKPDRKWPPFFPSLRAAVVCNCRSVTI